MGWMKIYINGNPDQNIYKQNSNHNTGSILHLGKTPESTLFFDGLVDDLRIYNRTLTDAEVQAVYNLGL